MRKTVVLQIGNSDDKLTQSQWCDYVERVSNEVHLSCWEIHFSGASDSVSEYQNACWVFEIEEDRIDGFQIELFSIKKIYKQDSIAWLEGEIKFL